MHALAYTLVLFLAGIYGERPRSAKEVVLATQRALEQRALELWRLQKDAEIEGMMRRGEPLGAVAAALASPETAERIAVLEAATSGRMSSLLAARLNVARAGGDLSVLDGLHLHQQSEQAEQQQWLSMRLGRRMAHALWWRRVGTSISGADSEIGACSLWSCSRSICLHC